MLTFQEPACSSEDPRFLFPVQVGVGLPDAPFVERMDTSAAETQILLSARTVHEQCTIQCTTKNCGFSTVHDKSEWQGLGMNVATQIYRALC